MERCPRCGRTFKMIALHRTRKPGNPCSYSTSAWLKILDARREANLEKTRRWKANNPGVAEAAKVTRKSTAESRQKAAEVARRARRAPDAVAWRQRLSARQVHHLALYAEEGDRATAALLAGISQNTYDNYLTEIYRVLEVAGAIDAFRRMGWLVVIRPNRK